MSRPNGRVRRVLNPRHLVAGCAVIVLVVLCLSAETIPSSTAGYIAKISNPENTTATAPYFKCSDAEAADKSTAVFQYDLNETSGSTTASDSSTSADPGTYQGTMTTSTTAPIACSRDTGGAFVLNGTTSYISTATSSVDPTTFTEEVWFKTTVARGKLIGFGNAQTGSSSSYDRHVYMSTTGQLVFGIQNTAMQIVTSPKKYNDGKWHQVAATLSPTTGMSLYVDGALVEANTAAVTPATYTGYWRVGYDNESGWPNPGSTYFFKGSLRYAAVYSTVLTPQQISNHYAAGQ